MIDNMEDNLGSICNVLEELFNIPTEVSSANKEKSLFLEPFFLRPTELLFLFFYLEEKCKVFFDENVIFSIPFMSIQNINSIIDKSIKK